jgi:hypothetical protein
MLDGGEADIAGEGDDKLPVEVAGSVGPLQLSSAPDDGGVGVRYIIGLGYRKNPIAPNRHVTNVTDVNITAFIDGRKQQTRLL